MRYLATILLTLSLTLPALSIELFRYLRAAKDGGTLEYVFDAGEQNSPNAVTKEKAAEIGADFMTTFYHVQVGSLETQEFRTTPVNVARCKPFPMQRRRTLLAARADCSVAGKIRGGPAAVQPRLGSL
jgi:hypothetical protein